MSRLENLVELIRTTNEVYFITAPERVRAAYILVDDIVELALKTFLQERTHANQVACMIELEAKGIVVADKQRTKLSMYFKKELDVAGLAKELGQNGTAAQAKLNSILSSYGDLHHWSINNPTHRADFYDVIADVKKFFPPTDAMHTLLSDAFSRHETRNRLYHDHHHTPWSISDKKCLHAMCALYDLLEKLFPDFYDQVQRYSTVGCQIAVLRLKLAVEEGAGNDLQDKYKNTIGQLSKKHVYDADPRSVEHSLIHTVSNRFFLALQAQFQITINTLKVEIDEIEKKKRPKPEQLANLRDNKHKLSIFESQLRDIELLLGGLSS